MNIGDKVVCVDDDWSKCWDDPHSYFSTLPQAGRTYVVKTIGLANNGERQIGLVGIEARNIGRGIAGFYPHRFRLLSEIRSDKAIERVKEKARF